MATRPPPTTHQALAAFRQESAKLLIFYDDAGVKRHEQAPWWLGTSLEDGEEPLELFPGVLEVEVEDCVSLPVRRVSEDVGALEQVIGERLGSVRGGVREESVRLVRKREKRKKEKKRGGRERGAVPKARKRDRAAVVVAPVAPVVVASGGDVPDLPYSSMYDRIKRRKCRR